MAKTVIGVELKAETSGVEKSVGSFKQKLREANQELLGLTEKFGATSKEATEAAKKVANLKDAIGDAKALSDSFSPDAPFTALGGAITGAVSGFQALQGVQALFGSESEELNKTLVKLNAAMALSQGVNGLFAAKDAFVNLSAVIKTQVVGAFSTLRGAIISTGIGAIAIGVLAIATNFEKVKQTLINLIPGLKQVFEFIGNIADKAKEWLGISEDQLDTQKALADATSEANEFFGKQFAEIDRLTNIDKLRAKARGATQAEIDRIELQGLQNKKRIVDGLIEQNKRLLGADDTALQQQLQKLNQEIELKGLEQAAANAEKRKEVVKKVKDDTLAEEAKFQESLRKQRQDQDAADLLDFEKRIEAESKAEDEANKAQAENKIFWDQYYADAFVKNLEEQQAADKAAAEAKIQTLNLVANTAETFANLLGKQTAAGKALAIASATINTYQGASEALKANYGAFGPAAQVARVLSVAAVIATGLKQVREIAKIKVPGGGGGSVPSAPSISSFAPQATTTSLNQQSINAIGNVAARAYVLETDVSGNQERVRRLNRAARIN